MPIPLIAMQFCGSLLSGTFWLAKKRSDGDRPYRLPEARRSVSESLRRYIALSWHGKRSMSLPVDGAVRSGRTDTTKSSLERESREGGFKR